METIVADLAKSSGANIDWAWQMSYMNDGMEVRTSPSEEAAVKAGLRSISFGGR